MNILFITDLIPTDKNENCAKALIPIIKELQSEHTVDIIRPNFILNSFIRGKMLKPNGHYNYEGLNILNLNFHTPFLFLDKNFNINLQNYDEIIAHMPSGILFAQKLLSDYKNKTKSAKCPTITYAVHQSDIQVMSSLKYSFYFKSALKTAYQNCDKIICRAPHLKEKLLKILPECEAKTTVKISKIPQKYLVSEDLMLSKFADIENLKLITVANLIKRKNIDILIKSLVNFKDKNFSLKIIGDGQELSNLKKLTKKLNLSTKIEFAGKKSHDKVFEEMKKSHVFILPSKNETLGLVYLEAAASGCLCVGTENTGIDGIFQDNINCFLCKPTVNGVSKVLKKIFSLTQEDFTNLLKNRKLIENTFIS